MPDSGVKFNTKQRVLGAVLVVGGCAVAVDKFVIGYSNPAPAAAANVAEVVSTPESSPAPTAAASVTNAAPIASALPTPGGTRQSLTDSLAKLGEVARSDDLQDPFQPPASWRPAVAASAEPAQAPAAKETELPAAHGAPGFKLSMVMVPKPGSDDAPLAVLDGQPYPLGATIGGYTVASITSERVILRQDNRVYELLLPRPADKIARK